jgi:hypothetical protein
MIEHLPIASRRLLPEEDAIDDPDEDDEADPTVPGDLWFHQQMSSCKNAWERRRILAGGQVIRR